jgi:hypothetical protein
VSEPKLPKPVKVYAVLSDIGGYICWGERMYRSRADVLANVGPLDSKRWIRVEIRPVPQKRRKKSPSRVTRTGKKGKR